MAKIIGPGSLIVDVTGYAPHLPVAGETVKGSKVSFGPGGKGSNQMTASSRAGAEAFIIGKTGNDILSETLKSHYQKEKMSEKYIKVSSESQTGCALIEIDETNAQNRIIAVLGANEDISDEEVLSAEKDFKSADVVLTQFETNISAIKLSKVLAKKYNKVFIFNPAPYREIEKSFFDGIDYITPNETEAEQYTGVKVETLEDCKKAAEKFFEFGVKNVIITLSSRGVYFSNKAEEIFIKGIKMNSVDTTGAGDSFNGAFATAIGEGVDIKSALQFANCAGAISVTRYGASNSAPYREEIISLMKEQYGKEI